MTKGGGEGGGAGRPRAYDAAVRLLAPRSLTVSEIRARLARRGYSGGEIQTAIDALLERGYLNDGALAYNVATSLAERRLFGKSRVAAELRRRGVAADAIREAIERAFAGLDEDAMAREAAGRAGVAPEDRRGRERAARALLRRGFSRGAVARALAGAQEREESEDLRHDDEFEADS